MSFLRAAIWLVELDPLAAAEYVVPTLATTLGLRETPGLPLVQLVIDYLRLKQVLLILDNCEHLVEFCAQLAHQLLQACPLLKLIASSREALGIAGETVYRVPPLSLPEITVSAATLMASEAGRLFVERATKVEPRFKLTEDNASDIAQICLHLDGIPLALELAAGRVQLFTPGQIAGRLDDRFKLLTGGSRTALPRQQTLRAMIDWSYQMLNDEEQRLLRQLAVFAGGWTFEAVEAVIGELEALEGLFGLVNKSLVNVEEQAGKTRYRFLETIHQYALEKLEESGESTDARNRHLDYLLDYAHQTDPSTFSPQNQERLDQLELEHDNLRAALEWGVTHQLAKAMRLAEFLSGFWSTRNYLLEARYWCQKILTRSEGIPALENARARVFGTLGWVAALQGDHQAGFDASQAGLLLARQLNDSQTVARCLSCLAFSALYLGDSDQASTAAEESEAIAREMGYTKELAISLVVRSSIAFLVTRDLVAARNYLEESLALGQAADLPWVISFSVHGLARIAGAAGDMVTARRRFEESILLGLKMGNRHMSYASRSELAHLLRKQGELDEPLAIYKELLLGWRELGHRSAVAHELECMAYIFRRSGQALLAAKLLGAAEVLRLEINASLTNIERDEYEREISELRALLNEAVFTQAWAEGRSLTMDEAIALAINASPDHG